VIAGPARVADATPVKTKMPVPMIAPIPIAVSDQGPSVRLNPVVPVLLDSARMRSSGLTRSSNVFSLWREG
jgi:hypothetical protein